jgi:uncharacterized repeat protein (TIGR03803 family)
MARGVYGTSAPSPYGPIVPIPDDTTGLPLLELPEGFRYLSYGWRGDVMSDGVPCPGQHDGMGVVGVEGDTILIVRNHEQSTGRPYLDAPSITYAPDGAGGTTTLTFDVREGRWVKMWSSLAGTVRNCAGGVTPWGTWITGEETLADGHGWLFEVAPEKGVPVPLRAMGRFVHEAVMVDPSTGYVYETEDESPAGFYRFVPIAPGRLEEGGDLFMLKVKNRPNLDLAREGTVGTIWDVEWVPVPDPPATARSPHDQGKAAGGASFRRLEGCWWGERSGYFVSTNGGPEGEGQVFEYDPETETLTLLYASPSGREVDNPDNLTVTPRGGLLLCEDAAGDSVAGERLVGLTLEGTTFVFARNNVRLARRYNDRVGAGDYTRQEFAGACYSPDGRWLFVNVQVPGITFAITGPWGSGPL